MRGGFPEFGRIRRIVSDVRKRFFQALESYNTRGQITVVGGSSQYLIEYSYDEYGRRIALYTLRGATNGWDITRWYYDEGTGLLTHKVYADGNGPSYTYTSYGKLETRNWARGVTTAYSYDPAGSLTNTTYSDGTPSVSISYNRLGQKTQVVDASGTNTFAYDSGTLALTNETQLVDYDLTRVYDDLGRAAGYELQSQAPSLQSVAYGYDDLGRFSSVSSAVPGVASGAVVVNYSYLEDSDLLSGYTNNFGFAVEYGFEDPRNLKTDVLNSFGTNTTSSFNYLYDEIGRRTQRLDTSLPSLPSVQTNLFSYNDRSEVVSALMGTNDYGYAYDNIGNRISATNNGQMASYLANELNQYTSISNSMPPAPSSLLYDLDGNMTSYNGWTFKWNGENRLIQASNATTVVTYAYDHRGRMFEKIISGEMNRFVWDGFNIIAEMSSSQTNLNIWGLDISQSLQNAGGIGGLLAVSVLTNSTASTYLTAYDANGNITEYVTTNGTVVAHYEYDPYGNIISQDGSLADAFTHRFSTKPYEAETGLIRYQIRSYIPALGRWLSRDPMQEKGGVNLYAFNQNDGANFVDPLGLEEWGWPVNGSVENDGDFAVDVLVGGETYTLQPGESTPDNLFNSVDVDGVWINGEFHAVDAGENFKIEGEGPVNPNNAPYNPNDPDNSGPSPNSRGAPNNNSPC